MATATNPVNEADIAVIPETEVLIKQTQSQVNAPPPPPGSAPSPSGGDANVAPMPPGSAPAPNKQASDSKNPVGCPKGLEYLVSINQLFVKQKVEVLEAMTGFETNNVYHILNCNNQKVYTCVEENDCCTRGCCGSYRRFNMKVVDNFQNVVLNFERPFRCNANCFCCLGCLCGQVLNVMSSDGTYIGSVCQDASLGCGPRYSVYDHNNEPQLRIRGPACFFKCCDIDFKVYPYGSGEEIGRISKEWSGLAKEIMTDADNFGVTFPLDLDARMKACLIGGVMLLDFIYFENNTDEKK